MACTSSTRLQSDSLYSRSLFHIVWSHFIDIYSFIDLLHLIKLSWSLRCPSVSMVLSRSFKHVWHVQALHFIWRYGTNGKVCRAPKSSRVIWYICAWWQLNVNFQCLNILHSSSGECIINQPALSKYNPYTIRSGNSLVLDTYLWGELQSSKAFSTSLDKAKIKICRNHNAE